MNKEMFTKSYRIDSYDTSKFQENEIFQWAQNVVSYSSSYNSGWEANTLVGPPRVYPNYGDIRGAWAPAYSSGTKENLVLSFSTPVYITGVDIFETYCPGHVCLIEALNKGQFKTLWKHLQFDEIGKVAENGVLHSKRKARIFSPPIEKIYFKTDTIQIHLDCTYSPTWAEIDCVILRGVESIDWTKETNKYFPASFKAMVKTLLLINQSSVTVSGQLWLPKPLIFIIIQYCALGWVEPSPPQTPPLLPPTSLSPPTPSAQQEIFEATSPSEKPSKCLLS